MSTNKNYVDNKNLDSGDPLLNKNIYSNVGPSGSSSNGSSSNGSNNNATHNSSNGNSSNNSSTTPNGVATSESNNLKQTKSEFEYSSLEQRLEQTIAKLKTQLFAMFAVSVAGFIIVIIIVTVLYVNLNYDLAHHKHTPKVSELIGRILDKEELCVPCRMVAMGPSRQEAAMLNQFTRKEVSPNNFDCCVETPQQLVELLKMFIEKRFREEAARGFPGAHLSKDSTMKVMRPSSNYSRPVANVQIMPQPIEPEENGKLYNINYWNSDQDLAFTANGVRYRSGRLVVPEDGYYYVYSHVSFLEMDVNNNAHNSLSHYLYRYNAVYNSQEKLAQNSITKCAGLTSPVMQAGEYYSSLGAVFKLRARDEIWVKVSNLTIMNTDSKQGHFGLFQVS